MNSPFRFCTATLVVLFASCVLVAPPMLAQTLLNDVDSILVAADFNGVALVASEGDVVIEQGYGFADIAASTPNTPGTRLLIGSVTKQFTAALTLMLMEDGLLDLHVPIDTYLSDYPQPQGSQITLHHLLTHTSGIPNYNSLPGFNSGVPHTPAELVALFADLPLEFEPGSQFRYSNSGYTLSGRIIEAVTGQSYASAFEERIAAPFGLNDTGYPDPDYDGIATGYRSGVGGTLSPAPYVHPSVPYAAGALYSTAGDLYRWDQLLYGDMVFVDPATKALYFEEHVETPEPPGHHAYGWYVGYRQLSGIPDPFYTIGHTGSVGGFQAWFERYVEDGHTVVLLSNVRPAYLPIAPITIALYTFPTVGAEPEGVVPRSVTLNGPYPNPASASVTLPFNLDMSSHARVTLHDVIGREVAVLADGRYSAGHHEVALDGSRLAPGLYVVRLTTGGEVVTRRITVVH